MKKLLSFFIILLLFGLSFHSTILAKQQESDINNYYDIEVEFLGIDNNENKKIKLSEDDFQSFIKIINQFEEKKKNYRSFDENRILYNEIIV